jgi:cytochrome o ubiquinol oxidase operon protein cyoD
MSTPLEHGPAVNADDGDSAPGDESGGAGRLKRGFINYLVGLGLAVLLTVASFWAAQTHLIYGPGVSVALVVFAVAQMGIHLVFFLHITTAPDNTNNVLALAFGVLIACLIIFGSLWIMANLDHNMMAPEQMQRMQP